MGDRGWGRSLLAIMFCSLLALAAKAQAAPASETNRIADNPLRISVLTFAPGETYWQRFGHNAILVENTTTGANAVYNYGMFDFFQKNFFLNFARGHMVYRLDVDSLDRTLYAYASEGRWVYQQVLNLDAVQRLQLAQFLDRNAEPENAEYRYDYFRDNCSTRVRDAIDQVLSGALGSTLRAQAVPVSYRSEATRLMRPIAPLALGMDLILGPSSDAPISRWEQSFVPEVLMQALATQRLNGQPLVAEARFLLADQNSPVAPAEPLHWHRAALGIGLVLGLLLFGLGRLESRLAFGLLATPLLLLAGFAGLMQLAAWTLTEHWAMHANFNLLLFSPLALLLLPTAWRRPRPANQPPRWPHLLVWVLLLGAGLSLLGGQHNAVWVLLWLPVQASLSYGLLRRA